MKFFAPYCIRVKSEKQLTNEGGFCVIYLSSLRILVLSFCFFRRSILKKFPIEMPITHFFKIFTQKNQVA